MTAGLLTLVSRPGLSLVALPLLFTDARFRHGLVHRLTDRLALEPFWAWYEALSAAEPARAPRMAPLGDPPRVRRSSPGFRAGGRSLSGFGSPRRRSRRGSWSMGPRTARVATPVLDRLRIVKLQGYVQEVDLRPQGARLVLAVANAGDMPANLAPRRVRVTTRKAPDVAAGDYVALQARLLPPSHAALPGGYDFARDAFFQGVGAVGSTLGAISVLPPPRETSWRERFAAAIDQARNRLALRVDAIIGGDEGAIAAAMVTGKRDFLSNDARDLIREAGIFHIITISGVQMTWSPEFSSSSRGVCSRSRRRWR